MMKDLSYVDIQQLEQYTTINQNTIESASADKAVEEFLDNYKNWKEVVGYMVDAKDGARLYGAALCTYAGNLCLSNLLSEDTARLLHDELSDYEGKVKYMYGFKNALYINLAICLHKLSLASNEKLKKYLKKAIYYSQAEANHTSYQVECYAYRTTNKYLLDSLKNETLSMSSPTTFNDPFDCPILELLTLYGDDISRLISESYKECLKITCFVKNTKVQPKLDNDHNLIWEQKHDNDPEEYLNDLMWAHYADNHKGVCIKYHFNNDMTKFADEAKSQVAYFRDVEYTSDMDSYRKNGAINLQDAFFAKGQAWEYENELRLLSYDPKGTGDYASIDAKNSIVAVYFGLKCPKDQQTEIIDILKGRKWVSEKSVWDVAKHSFANIKEEHPVEFFQMEVDKTHFGKLKAVKYGDL